MNPQLFKGQGVVRTNFHVFFYFFRAKDGTRVFSMLVKCCHRATHPVPAGIYITICSFYLRVSGLVYYKNILLENAKLISGKTR